MSSHTARVTWSPAVQGAEPPPFTYETYSRDHRVAYGTGSSTALSAAPEYRGNPALPNPEELLVAALSSCHMLTFLAIAVRKGLTVTSYVDDAVGTLAKDESGVLCVTDVALRPVVGFAAEVDGETLARLHASAHRGCFIANSVKTKVTVA